MALALLPQADGRTKPRPVILLRRMPPFDDWLVCGVSTQLHQEAAGFEETILPAHTDFRRSGLKAPSLIRLGSLSTACSEFLVLSRPSATSDYSSSSAFFSTAPSPNPYGRVKVTLILTPRKKEN